MTFTSKLLSTPVVAEPVRSMTMVQSDWYHPDRDLSLSAWAHAVGVDDDAVGGSWHSRYLYSADPLVEAGLHVAFFESSAEVDAGAWSSLGAPGPSPTRPFKGLFEERGQDGDAPPPQPVYVSHWEPIGTLG
jgi:hypothetical protein